MECSSSLDYSNIAMKFKTPKSLKISKQVSSTLLVYVLLVYFGFKDSYLVDCCSLTVSDASALLRSISQTYGLDLSLLCLISLDFDVIIANKSILFQKIECDNDFVIVDISDETYRLLEHSSLIAKQFREHLSQSLSSTGSLQSVPESSQIRSAIGFPCFAGWLLGYPSVYMSTSMTNSATTNDGIFQVVELRKDSLLCVNQVDSSVLELMSFSIPSSMLSNSVQSIIEQSLSSKQQQFNNLLAFYKGDSEVCIFQSRSLNVDKSRLRSAYAACSDVLKVSSISMTSELVTVSSIRL